MIYFFDGTPQGFFTAFPAAYKDDDAYLTASLHQTEFFRQTTAVKTNPTLAERVKNRLYELDKGCVKELNLLLRSGEDGYEQTAFRYIKLIAQYKRPVRLMLSLPDVINATELLGRIKNEIHRMHGFLRFTESESGALYAPIRPDHDICDLLVPHFRARLPEYPFVIHDIRRKKAAVYDGKHTFCAPLDKAEIVLSAKETEWQALWKRYYKSVNIPSRERLKQMRGYLPARYWKLMPEFSINCRESD